MEHTDKGAAVIAIEDKADLAKRAQERSRQRDWEERERAERARINARLSSRRLGRFAKS